MKPLLKVSNVSRDFIKSLDLVAKFLNRLGQDHREEIVHAVDDVSFEVFKGEVVGIVGESGCGKSTLGKMVAGILPPTAGQVHFDSANKSEGATPDDLKTQMIFQDPFSSLNPRKKVIDILTEAPVHHGLIKASEKREFALDMLNRFVKLKQDYDLTYLFISHDIGVIEHIWDRVIVMYLGRIVETAPIEAFVKQPNHPYTKALLEGVPRLEIGHRDYEPVSGEIPSPLDPPTGCHFHPRCKLSSERCKAGRPALVEITPDHFSACHLNDSE